MPRAVGAASPKACNVCHDIVPQLLFVVRHGGEVNCLGRSFHFADLLGLDRQAGFALRFGQCDPDPPPSCVAAARAPDGQHLARGVARGERVLEGVFVVMTDRMLLVGSAHLSSPMRVSDRR